MKNLYLILLFVMTSACALAQAPGQINYQAVARNAVGNVLPNQDVKLRISIRDGGPTGTIVYQETRTIKTNLFGMFNIAIGSPGASGVIGSINGVNWAATSPKFLQVEMDPTGVGNNMMNMGASQLLSVPFALFAGSSVPAGPAGGSLTGSYPNPKIAEGAVENINIKDGAVTTSKITDGTITAAKLAPGVIPAYLPPGGAAGGDLTGTFPNPSIALNAITNAKLADNAVTTNKIQDASVTSAKLAPGIIPTTLPPSGAAGGDLTGSYPAPTIADNAISTNKLQDGSVTLAKLAPGLIGGSTPTGPAGGDLGGSYPNPSIALNAITNAKLADNAVNTTKIQDASVTSAKLAPGVIPTTLPPSGVASGDLTGFYPAPTIAANVIDNTKLADNAVSTNKLQDGSVTLAKLAPGIIGGSTPTGPAGGDLSGTYPNPTIADNAISTPKLQDGSVTLAKLAPGVIGGSTPTGPAGGDLGATYPNPSVTKIQGIPVSTTAPALNEVLKFDGTKWAPAAGGGGSTPTGPAGGDLNGAYPNPNIAPQAVTTNKLAPNAVTTQKLDDGAVTAIKIAPGVIPTSLPPNGTASGDLSGTYPSPLVAKLRGVNLSATAPTTGQVLKFDGTQWAPGTDNTGSGGGLTLPYTSSLNNASNLFSLTNTGAGAALHGVNSSTNANAYGIYGQITAGTPGASSAAIKGQNNGSGTAGYGIWGVHAGGGFGVYGVSTSGSGVKGSSTSGNGLEGFSSIGKGLFATSTAENAAFFDISSTSNVSDAVFVSNLGLGNGVGITTDKSNAVLAITNDVGGAGVLGVNMNGGEAVIGRVFGDNGTGVIAQANAAGGTNGNALVADLLGGNGNIAAFRYANTNMARIDQNGKGFFNGGTQVGGADVAEYFAVDGKRAQYEPGDVLVISETADRTVTKSSAPYSTLVAGVYATKPGLSLTEEDAVKDQLDAMVPMGVIGVIPTKVCLEGGAIKRGDLIVTSSISGVAMKADPDKVRVGQVLGKALQDYNAPGVGKINVLVSVK